MSLLILPKKKIEKIKFIKCENVDNLNTTLAYAIEQSLADGWLRRGNIFEFKQQLVQEMYRIIEEE